MAAPFTNYGGFATPTPVAIGTNANPNWGSTFSGDLINKVNFGAYVREQLYGRCQWVQSGIIQRNSALDMSGGGTRIEVPFFRPFLGTVERIESNATWGASGKGYLSPSKITADKQVAAVMHEGMAWAADDLSAMSSGADPMAAIASYLSDNVLRFRTKKLLKMIDGVLGATGMTSHDIKVARTAAGTSTEANFLSAANVIKATTVLGENASQIRYIAMHSHVVAQLKVLGMLTFSTSALSTGGGIAWGGGGIGIGSTEIANFAGLQVIVDDLLAPTVSATNGDSYPVLLFGPGAVQMGIQRDFRVETERNILSKQWIASADWHQLLHIDGISYGGTDNPDEATLATPGSWELKYPHQQIPVVRMWVNSAYAQNP